MSERPWWRTAVIYEVYPRSFADANGDGEGDIEGLRQRLPYLAELGVDALWIAPWYPSPMEDGGYDVADYCNIDPRYGTLADADRLIAEAASLGIRIIIDLVANHCSEQHPWFQAALKSAPGSAERELFYFRDGLGEGGNTPPNNWISNFGGIGWTRTTNADGTPGQWYLHTFAPSQPDLNWQNPRVQEMFDDVLRFWFDRGVAGVRADAVPAMAKKPGLPDADYEGKPGFRSSEWTDNPHWDVPEVHEYMRRWRRVSDEYEGDRMFVTEAVVSSPERLALYVRPDEMHTSFNFDFLLGSWHPEILRSVIDTSLASLAPYGAPSTWVLSNHDVTRHLTRFGREQQGKQLFGIDGAEMPSHYDLGARRSRAAIMLMLSLPGSVYLYQGEELGLPNVDDLPDEVLQDPIFFQSGGTNRGRDGCRVPLPWSGDVAPFGFGPNNNAWLPQPVSWSEFTAERQASQPDSMLNLYRAAIALRKRTADLVSDEMSWTDSTADVLSFSRGDSTHCIFNFGETTVVLPEGAEVLMASAPLENGALAKDTAVWVTL
ncbi:MAG: hypothetical protein RL441_8 [Actinomycetota bacterium]